MELITKEDLQALRLQIINDFRMLLEGRAVPTGDILIGYKTADLREIFDCSVNKIKSLAASGKLRRKRIGGTVYYNKEDVRKLMEQGFK